MRKLYRAAAAASIILPFMLSVGAPAVTAQSVRKLAVLPFRAYDIDSASTRTLLALLRRELEKSGTYTIVEESQTPQIACQDPACAADAGEDAGAARVVYGSFGRLGAKVLWAFTLVDVKGRSKIFAGDITGWEVEEFEESVPRIARSIEAGVMEHQAPGRDGSRPSTGKKDDGDPIVVAVGIGQMYPTHGYIDRTGSYPDYQPDTLERAFILDSRVSIDRGDHMLDLLVGIRHGILVNLGATYLPIRSSVTPFIGGGIGYHIQIDIDEDSFDNDDSDEYISGFNAMIRGGLWVLRTSSIRAFVNVDYMYTFNSRDDQAVTLTIGAAGITDVFDF